MAGMLTPFHKVLLNMYCLLGGNVQNTLWDGESQLIASSLGFEWYDGGNTHEHKDPDS